MFVEQLEKDEKGITNDALGSDAEPVETYILKEGERERSESNSL